jgi:hypothetical protein
MTSILLSQLLIFDINTSNLDYLVSIDFENSLTANLLHRSRRVIQFEMINLNFSRMITNRILSFNIYLIYSATLQIVRDVFCLCNERQRVFQAFFVDVVISYSFFSWRMSFYIRSVWFLFSRWSITWKNRVFWIIFVSTCLLDENEVCDEDILSLNKKTRKVNIDEEEIYLGIRVVVGLNWTRARAFNPRFGQGWTYSSRPSGSNELRFLFERSNELRFLLGRITRARTFVRRIESNRHTCSSNTQLEFRLIQKSRVELSNRGLNSQFCSTGWAEQAILFDGLTWVSSFVRARVLD